MTMDVRIEDPQVKQQLRQAITTMWTPMPAVELSQLQQMSDDTGMFQHAIYGLPDPNHGYCIDDNVRALIAGLLHAELFGEDEAAFPVKRYLTFVRYAYNPDTQTFRNFMSYDRRWLEDQGSQDSQGRAFWGLGLTVAKGPTGIVRDAARDVMRQAMSGIRKFAYLRSWAFAMVGLDAFLSVQSEDGFAMELMQEGSERLYKAWLDRKAMLGDTTFEQWPWWEDTVTYDNAKLCHALMLAGRRLGEAKMVEAGLVSLRWLLDIQTAEQGHLSIVGNDGWYQRGREKAKFDQQPLEAYALLDASLEAARLTGDVTWLSRAWMCFLWFMGHNDLNVPIYHVETGGCQDGLQPDGANRNQGAESLLAYLISVLQLHRFRLEVEADESAAT